MGTIIAALKAIAAIPEMIKLVVSGINEIRDGITELKAEKIKAEITKEFARLEQQRQEGNSKSIISDMMSKKK